jgi:hypothetical protein
MGQSWSLSNRLRVILLSFSYIRFLRPRTFFFPSFRTISFKVPAQKRVHPSPTFSISSCAIDRINYAGEPRRLGAQWCWSSRPGRSRSWTTAATLPSRCCGARAERNKDKRPQAHRRRQFLVCCVASPPPGSLVCSPCAVCSWFHFKVCLVAGTGFFTDA